METMQQFNNVCVEEIENYYKKRKEIEEDIKNLETKKENLRYPRMKSIFTSIAEQIQKRLKASGYVFYGPFGLCCETTIYWLKDMEKDIIKDDNILGGLTLISNGNEWAIRDKNKVNDNYAKGSIAEMNGMNYATVQIEEKMNIDWLVEFAKEDG